MMAFKGERSRRKEAVKTAAIIFLTILLILTFFSKTITNYSLTQVQTQQITSKNLALTVRVSGTVQAAGILDVCAQLDDGEKAVVSEVFVSDLDVVSAGDVLCSLKKEGSGDDDSVQEQIAQLQDSYQTLVLNSILSADEIARIKNGERTTLEECSQTISGIRTQLEASNARVEELNAAIIELNRQAAVLAASEQSDAQVQLALAEHTAAMEAEEANASGLSQDLADEIQRSTQRLEMGSILDEINELSASLSEEADDIITVTAAKTGRVTDIGCAVGQTVTGEDLLMKISPAEDGEFTMTAAVTKSQAQMLSVGMEAVASGYWAEGFSAKIAKLSPSAQEAGNYDVTFSMTGDLTDGQGLTLEMKNESTYYEQVIPNGALHEDASGKFVWVLISNTSSFGTYYTVSRAEVFVLAAGENETAITSQLESTDHVVITSTASLEDGQRVRLTDN